MGNHNFPQKSIFLSAEWRDLVNLTYRVPKEKLEPFLPDGVELDLWEGEAHLSLVAFDFINTQVKGIKIPFHINFPEVNLRFYVKSKHGNGVQFIEELVPKHAIAWTAKLFYNEPYRRVGMQSEVSGDETRLVKHELRFPGRTCRLEVEAGASLGFPKPGVAEYFFKEHDLGYGVRRNGQVLCYQVKHPEWEIREVNRIDLDWDFGASYGQEWAFLNEMEPRYAVYCVGSAVKVYAPFKLADLKPKT